jgi:hypothetical protein
LPSLVLLVIICQSYSADYKHVGQQTYLTPFSSLPVAVLFVLANGTLWLFYSSLGIEVGMASLALALQQMLS